MARRRHRVHHRRRKATTHRRRRIGAASMTTSNPILLIGTVAAGYFLAGTVNPLLDKIVPATMDQKIVGAAETGIGALLLLKKGRKTMLTTVAGGVFAGAGLKRLMDAMKTTTTTAVTGWKQVPVIGGGYKMVPVIGSPGYTVPNNAEMNGYNVPPAPSALSKIMGCTGGSDLMG